MKKIILTFFVLLLTVNISFAWECSIENKTPQEFSDYLKNNSKVLKNINELIKNKEENQLSNNNIKAVINWSINYKTYLEYNYYYTVYRVLNSVPYSVDRDNLLLENEYKKINLYIDNLIKNKKTWVIINKTEVCEWIKFCNFKKESWTALYYIWEVLKNNNSILTYYRSTASKWTKENDIFILVDNNFSNFIYTNYWKENTKDCSSKMSDISDESSNNLKSIWDRINNWFKKWDEAISLMFWWTSNEEYRKTEKKLLKKELSRQWVPYSKQESILLSLNKFNSEGFTLSSNPLVDSYNQIANELGKIKEKTFKPFEDFLEDEEWKSVTVNNLLKTDKEYSNSELINQKVAELNLNIKNNLVDQEIASKSTYWKLKKIHNNLKLSINILDKAYKKSIEVCKSQWWQWSCN